MRTFTAFPAVAARSAVHDTGKGRDGMRLQRIAVALVAAVAISAIVASAAQAAEYGRCLKTTQVGGHYTGNFKNGTCTMPGAAGASKYEWYPGLSGPASQPRYTVKAKSLTIGEASLGSLVCGAGTDVGEITGVNEGWDVSTAKGCIGSGLGYELACNSPGEPSETIETSRLRTYVSTSGTGQASTEYSGSPYALIECGGFPAYADVEVFDAVSGATTPTNKMTKKFTTSFTLSGGQDLEFFYWDPYCSGCGPEHATLERTAQVKFNEKWEIKT